MLLRTLFPAGRYPMGAPPRESQGEILSTSLTDIYRFSFNLTEVTASAKTFFVTNTLFGLLVNGNAVDLSAVMNSGPNTNNFSPSTGLSIPGFFFQLGSNTILFETHSLTGGNAGDPFLAARVDIRAVPEPSTWAMMLGGGGLFLAIQRLRRRGG